ASATDTSVVPSPAAARVSAVCEQRPDWLPTGEQRGDGGLGFAGPEAAVAEAGCGNAVSLDPGHEIVVGAPGIPAPRSAAVGAGGTASKERLEGLFVRRGLAEHERFVAEVGFDGTVQDQRSDPFREELCVERPEVGAVRVA